MDKNALSNARVPDRDGLPEPAAVGIDGDPGQCAGLRVEQGERARDAR